MARFVTAAKLKLKNSRTLDQLQHQKRARRRAKPGQAHEWSAFRSRDTPTERHVAQDSPDKDTRKHTKLTERKACRVGDSQDKDTRKVTKLRTKEPLSKPCTEKMGKDPTGRQPTPWMGTWDTRKVSPNSAHAHHEETRKRKEDGRRGEKGRAEGEGDNKRGEGGRGRRGRRERLSEILGEDLSCRQGSA